MGTKKYRWLAIVFSFIFVITTTSSPAFFASSSVFASIDPDRELPPPEVEVVNPYYTIERFTLDDGTMLEKNIINGPPEPPPGYEDARTASIQPLPSRGVITNFPSYDWVFGCSAVSGAMIAAYYDNNGYPDMYTGPTNGGVMPLTDTSWITWYDGYDIYPNNPLIASKNGVDGRSIKGSIDDYWVRYNSAASDPYITGGWPQHTWSDAIGDYMKTSQSAYSNVDGSTAFYNWISSSDPLTCTDMVNQGIDDEDGTYGRKLFYEARGYSVGDCYNQKTDNNGGGFTLSDFQEEIDAGHPVLLNLAGHSIVGYGYNGSTIYIRDTWDNNTSNVYTMTWGGSYDGMALQSVSVVRLVPLAAPPSPPTGVSASDGTYTDKVRITWTASVSANDYEIFEDTTNLSNGATKSDNGFATSYNVYLPLILKGGTTPPSDIYYQVYRNNTNSTAGAVMLVDYHPGSPHDDTTAVPGTVYYYWVKACDSGICSGFSQSDSGYRSGELSVPTAPDQVDASNGNYSDRVNLTWAASAGATYYKVYRHTIDNSSSATPLSDNHPSSPYNDYSAVAGTTYYYWVKACNSAGCSGFSLSDTGWLTTNSLVNGDFEQGYVGWTEYSSGGFELIYGDVSWAHSGSWLAYLGGYDDAVDQLYQDVTISASEPYINFWGIIDSEDICGWDYFYVGFGEDYWYIDLCSENNTSDWDNFYVDLSGYAGSTDTLSFIVETDMSGYSDFYLDTIFFSATEPSGSDPAIFLEVTSIDLDLRQISEVRGLESKDINK